MQQRDANGALTSCVREKCHEVIVLAPPCTLVVDFTATAVITPANSVNFLNTTTPANATDSVHWNFGDGTSSTDINPATHTYTQPGNYWVCLRVQQRDANGNLTSCVREKCQRIAAGTTNPGICTLQPFPNPVSTSVSVNVSLSAPQMIDIYIYNVRNTLVKEKHQAGVTGNNAVNVTTADLPFGIYFMKVVHGTETCYATFLKI
jgi:phage baseplate assembly protein gpV